ncbi:MAG: EamA family transporter, partial [Ottowia sp.]|nr:EamA family transporter [Ottowia sp.]
MTNTQTNTRRALALFIGAMLIYGSIGVFRRHIPLSSAALACVRGAIGGLFLWGFAALTRGTLRLGVEKKRIPPLALAGLVLGVNWMLLFEAYRYTTIAIATLCYAMQPVILIALSP